MMVKPDHDTDLFIKKRTKKKNSKSQYILRDKTEEIY